MKQVALFIIGICLLAACGQAGKSRIAENKTAEDCIRHAQGFTVAKHEGYSLIELNDPWNSGKIMRRYILVDHSSPLPKNLPSGTILRTPIRRIAVYTAVHAAIIDELGAVDGISGVCEPMFMSLPSVKKRITAGQIADLGMSTNPNVERMIDAGIEYIVATPFQNADYGSAGKTGIPIIECADYMEATPLGRAEWVRFFGLLLDRQDKADSIFTATENRYRELKAITRNSSRPSALTERKYGSSWYVPGGDSYISNFINDAGATNIFSYIAGTGSVPLSFETVLDKAVNADFWLIKYNSPNDMTYHDLLSEYPPYAHFDAFKKQAVYACNTGVEQYYEQSPIHPDYLLEDLIHIFHPELIPNYSPRYYRELGIRN